VHDGGIGAAAAAAASAGRHHAAAARGELMRYAAIAMLVGCAASPAPALQMNDLSVLLPMATTPDELGAYLTPDSPSANGPLLPAALYDADPNRISATGLRVVGFRLDPCFGATCDNQIRLVFEQLIGDAPTVPQAIDGGVHVTYSLTRDQLLAAVREIAAARAAVDDGDLGPLAVNPIVAREGLTGEMAQKLMAIVATYADGTKIERITTFAFRTGGSTTGQSPAPAWDMHGFMVASGVETPIEIPTLGPGTTSVSITETTAPLEGNLSPETTSPDDPALLADTMRAMAATPAARQAAFDAALRVENPTKNTPDTIDCASCHMAEPARVLVGEQMFGLTTTNDANAFAADASIPEADLAATTTTIVNPTNGVLDVHAFSYLFTTPMINQRVINETAANLAYLQPVVAAP
jgi:hypothetical protein